MDGSEEFGFTSEHGSYNVNLKKEEEGEKKKDDDIMHALIFAAV